MGIKIISAADNTPVTLGELRLHLKLDATNGVHEDDAALLHWLSDALAYAEHVTGRSLGVQTLELALDAFPSGAIDLPRSPASAITSVKYLDLAGALQTVDAANYSLDDYSLVNRVVPAYGYIWPSTQGVVYAVKVRYEAGADVLPGAIRSALLLMVGHWYETRSPDAKASVTDLPLGVMDLLYTQKVWGV